MMEPPKSPFVIAIERYLQQPTRKKRASFIERYIDGGAIISAEEIQVELMGLSDDMKQKTSRRLLWPVFEAVCDYDAVISALVQSDPMPSALVWGGLKAMLDEPKCFKRYKTTFEKLEAHLKKLTHELKRMREYEELFPESETMYDLLTQNYVYIIRFWIKVEEVCSSSALTVAAKCIISTSTKKLTEIIDAITSTGNEIAKLVPVIQERIRRGEKEDVISEQHKAGVILDKILRLRQEERDEHKVQQVLDWLYEKEISNDGNYRHQRNGDEIFLQGTGQWLIEDLHFEAWIDPSTQENAIWLHGGPGMGKSVMCARAVSAVRLRDPFATIAFQYYSFDNDNEHPTSTYRNIAAQLFYQLNEYDDILDQIINLTRSPDSEAAIKTCIELMITDAKQTYVFIDGIDEKCAESQTWASARDVLRFLLNLSRRPSSRLKLWCSSQNHQQIRDELSSIQEIPMNESTNGKDIEIFFENALRKKFEKRFSKFEAAGSKAFVLQELKSQAHGNFLWASLMLRTIEQAISMQDLREKLKEGLPEDFQKYLSKQVQNMKRSPFVVKILSLLTYAIRPLSLEELCEAIQTCETEPGQNLTEDTRIVADSIVENCSPLVRVDIIGDIEDEKHIFTLCHASVRAFLVKNPSILRDQEGEHPEVGNIEARLFADICLKYLQQPRYARQLRKSKESFATRCDQDVIEHHLLKYCVRYWGWHLEKLDFTPELGRRVEQFLRSEYFITCIQAQSLFVGGHFHVRVNKETKQTEMTRIFPRWFTENYHYGKSFRQQYHLAIKEWGYYLDWFSTVKGPYSGQIDRCLWGNLGKFNFMSSIPSRFKSALLEETDSELAQQPILSDHIATTGEVLLTFKINRSQPDTDDLDITYERWVLKKDHKTRYRGSQHLIVPLSQSPLSQQQIVKGSPKSPRFLLSDDGAFMYTNDQLYTQTKDHVFESVGPYLKRIEYVEELGNGRHMFAIASRRKVPESFRSNLNHIKRTTKSNSSRRSSSSSSTSEASNVSETDGIKAEEHDADNSNNESEDSYSNTEDESDDVVDNESDGDTNRSESDDNSNNEDSPSALTEASQSIYSDDGSIVIESDSKSNISESLVLEPFVDDQQNDLDSDLESIDSFSARESWSDGSSDTLSDEIQDDLIWNDWDSDDDLADFKDDTSSHVSDEFADDTVRRITAGTSVYGSSVYSKNDSICSRSHNPPRPFRYAAFEPTTEFTDEPLKSKETKRLEQLLQLEPPKLTRDCVCQIEVFPTTQETTTNRHVFRFVQRSKGHLIDSPPAFHPTDDLLVWPTGDGEILFANIRYKTYFMRKLCSGNLYESQCLISVKAKFSSCGQYLHLASVFGQRCPRYVDCAKCEEEMDPKVCPRHDVYQTSAHASIHLILYITTYRLSKRKLTRSPPRLIYRNVLYFDSGFEENKEFYDDPLKFTLTWMPEYLYVTTNNRQLQIYRLPLFQVKEKKEIDWEKNNDICENEGTVFLPQSTENRKVYFFPTSPSQSPGVSHRKHKTKKKEGEIVATVVLSSKVMDDLATGELARDSAPPQVLYLTKAQLGPFTPVKYSVHDYEELKQADTIKGGQLLAMFEKVQKCVRCGRVLSTGFDLEEF